MLGLTDLLPGAVLRVNQLSEGGFGRPRGVLGGLQFTGQARGAVPGRLERVLGLPALGLGGRQPGPGTLKRGFGSLPLFGEPPVGIVLR